MLSHAMSDYRGAAHDDPMPCDATRCGATLMSPAQATLDFVGAEQGLVEARSALTLCVAVDPSCEGVAMDTLIKARGWPASGRLVAWLPAGCRLEAGRLPCGWLAGWLACWLAGWLVCSPLPPAKDNFSEPRPTRASAGSARPWRSCSRPETA